MNQKKSRIELFFTFLVMALFLNFPIVSALQIANVQAIDVTDQNAVISWETDETANSFVSYGEEKENLRRIGDAATVTEHQLTLGELSTEQTYYFQVESDSLVDDNEGEFYSFTTLAVDTATPELNLEVPERVAGNRLEISGTTEVGAEVTLTVNGVLVGFDVAETGTFAFSDVFLQEETHNSILIKAVDAEGNEAVFSTAVFADTNKPEVELEGLPEYIEETFVEIKGTISEEVTFDIFVNEQVQINGQGTVIQEQLSLEEGVNEVKIVLVDAAGWVTEEEFEVISDTQAPFVTAELEKGNEYYENSAESTIKGETEAGAKVYLYVYRQRSYEFSPEFDQAWETVTADSSGNFVFADVDFEDEPLSLEDLAPRLVPTQLMEDISIRAGDEELQYYTYHIYLIAEDRAGKTSYWETTITVNTCFSTNFDFVPESVPQFQTPYRLTPSLLDDGRETVQALFSMNYHGDGVPERRNGEEVVPGYQILDVRFTPACTQSMLDEESTELGCQLITRREPTTLISGDDSSVYAEWDLASSAEFSERKDDFWDDFTERRRIVFPLKMLITYQDREGENQWGQTKVQTSCTELSYFVDIPLESSELIPDFLAEEGVDALDWTIEQLQTVRPIMEDVYFVTAISAVISFLLRMVTRWIRIFSSRLEGIFSVGIEGGCPIDQSELYLAGTLEDWQELGPDNLPSPVTEASGDLASVTLEEVCPSTASMWKLEAALDQAYRWTGDRAFCRAVPAGWTESESVTDINSVILQQQQCAVTGMGVPLVRRENCRDLLGENPVALPAHYQIDEVSVCWQHTDGTYYIRKSPETNEEIEDTHRGIYRLVAVGNPLQELVPTEYPLIVYRPDGSEDFFVGRDRKCAQICRTQDGYEADFAGSIGGEGCYKEVDVDGQTRLRGEGGRELIGERYAAGYTSDCFLQEDQFGNLMDSAPDETGLLQCVCLGEDRERDDYENGDFTLRTAKEDEPWSYRQEQIFKEERKTVGTYYPDVRYYSGRDLSGAFGANYLPDYLRSEPQVHEVNPHTQLLGTFQSICLPGILKNMVLWESILIGMRNCLVEAKYTGFQDAGMCKTLFTQYLCGMVYEGMAALTSSCSPSTLDQVDRDGTFGDVGVVLDEGFDALGTAVSSSIDDFKDDYGNAAVNEFFREGAQGFAQSICLAAFGEEFPLFDRNFLMDSAYAFPIATTPVIAPANREFSSYNPALQTAVYNYNVGAVILPGCRIRSWRMSLECIGPEAVGHPGVDISCDGEGCDCLNAQGPSPLEYQKEEVIYQGSTLESGRMYDVPLESPIRVSDSPYRYDHVKVEFFLDPAEQGNENLCFDDGYFDGTKGIYYEPISDISPGGTLGCNANAVTGEFECPELSSQFGFGGAYLEAPFVTCWNDRTETWMDCETPNMFVLLDEIKLRVHMNLDGEGQCLRRTVRNLAGVPEEVTRVIPENMPGFITYPDSLNILSEEMLGGSVNRITLVDGDSGCGSLDLISEPSSTSSGRFEFNYVADVGLIINRDIIFVGNYGRGSQSELVDASGNAIKDIDTLNNIEFNLNHFQVRNVLGSVSASEGGTCTYQTSSRSSSSETAASRNVRVTYELLERDESGSCLYANQPVRTAQGSNREDVTIRLQREQTVFQETVGLHDSFMSGYYDVVSDTALQLINQRQGDLTNALAIYYWTATYVIKGADEGNNDLYKTRIHNLLKAFFTREWGEYRMTDYDSDTRSTGEFQKIEVYLCAVADEYDYDTPVGRCASG